MQIIAVIQANIPQFRSLKRHEIYEVQQVNCTFGYKSH